VILYVSSNHFDLLITGDADTTCSSYLSTVMAPFIVQSSSASDKKPK
jgi:hypothetical protein